MRRGLPLLVLVGLTACGPEAQAPRAPVYDTGVAYLRPNEGTGGLWHYDPTDVIEQHDSAGGRFRVHYTRAGTHAVPSFDNDASGVPDYVELVADSYEAVATRYQDELGFRAPISDETLSGDNGGDGRFDVYLLDFGLSSDGHFGTDACLVDNDTICLGHILQENDFQGYGYPSLTFAARLLASHEYFHAVQAAYSIATDSIVSEGTAVWGSEIFDPATSDLRWQISGYLENADRSLDVPLPGPVDRFSYGSSLWWQFLHEKYGPDFLRTLWEHLERGQGLAGGLDSPEQPLWIEQVDQLLQRDHQSSFAEAFETFCIWNLYLSAEADPALSYAKGADYPRTKREPLAFPAEDPSLRLFHASVKTFELQAAGRQTVDFALVDLPETAEDETAGLIVIGASRVAGEWVFFADGEDGAAADGRITLDATGTSELLAMVINVERTGASKRPGLCAGSPEEVLACLERLDPPPVCEPPEDCGGGGGGDPDPKGCGCTALRGPGVDPSGPALGLLLLGLALGARRRRRVGLLKIS
ncbi:MAG: hypothetical protein P1V51_15455 [Deltaproteobacteria bacterium]|nr:hypothetical protein [Deltaproteobacteria bacterium]